jgi:hypothetical protein
MEAHAACRAPSGRRKLTQIGASLLDHVMVVSLVSVVCIGSVTELRHGILAGFCGYFIGGPVTPRPGFQGGGPGDASILPVQFSHYKKSKNACLKYALPGPLANLPANRFF